MRCGAAASRRSRLIGQVIRISGEPFEVIGITPKSFHGSGGAFNGTRLWIQSRRTRVSPRHGRWPAIATGPGSSSSVASRPVLRSWPRRRSSLLLASASTRCGHRRSRRRGLANAPGARAAWGIAMATLSCNDSASPSSSSCPWCSSSRARTLRISCSPAVSRAKRGCDRRDRCVAMADRAGTVSGKPARRRARWRRRLRVCLWRFGCCSTWRSRSLTKCSYRSCRHSTARRWRSRPPHSSCPSLSSASSRPSS